MELPFVCVYQPLLARTLLAIGAYTLACLIWRFRRGAPEIFAIVPLVIALPVTLLNYFENVPIAATFGRIVLAAATADAWLLLFSGTAASSLLALAAIVLAPRRGRAQTIRLLILGISCAIASIVLHLHIGALRRIVTGA